MDRKEKQEQVFVQLVNKQLMPFGKTFQDVKSDPQWYLRYTTSPDAEVEFMNWGVSLLMEELNLDQKQAEQEMSWFVVQWGLSTKGDKQAETVKQTTAKKTVK